jgi:mannose-6-phosphate isomerase-like protein (cupin superfamily)
MPPGTAEVNHFHRKARQFFYVLSGVAVLEVEGIAVELNAGEGLEMAPGILHQMSNRGTEEVHFLVVSQPPGHVDREVVEPT